MRGLNASPGIAVGRVRVAASHRGAATRFSRRARFWSRRMTSPDWVPFMRRAAAIVTDSGGMTSHAAIVSRELGLPCIVGTRDATPACRRQAVTVDGAPACAVRPGGCRAPTHGRGAAAVAPARRRQPPRRHGDAAL